MPDWIMTLAGIGLLTVYMLVLIRYMTHEDRPVSMMAQGPRRPKGNVPREDTPMSSEYEEHEAKQRRYRRFMNHKLRHKYGRPLIRANELSSEDLGHALQSMTEQYGRLPVPGLAEWALNCVAMLREDYGDVMALEFMLYPLRDYNGYPIGSNLDELDLPGLHDALHGFMVGLSAVRLIELERPQWRSDREESSPMQKNVLDAYFMKPEFPTDEHEGPLPPSFRKTKPRGRKRGPEKGT